MDSKTRGSDEARGTQTPAGWAPPQTVANLLESVKWHRYQGAIRASYKQSIPDCGRTVAPPFCSIYECSITMAVYGSRRTVPDRNGLLAGIGKSIAAARHSKMPMLR